MTDHVVPLFINGEEYRLENTFDVFSPDTGKLLHKCSIATKGEAIAAVDAAAKAFPKWRNTTPGQRRDILLKAAQVMTDRQQELSQYMKDEVGAADAWADFNLNNTIDIFKDVAGRISALNGTVPALSDPSRGAMIVKEPFGVVLGIAPWNAPYILGTRAILYPIAAGNTVVLKGSELSPRVFWGIASVLHDAGLPEGVLNFIATDPAHAAEVTSTLIAHPQVKKINFTGSTAVGKIISKLAGEHLKPVLLELGGMAPAIVWKDANLDIAAEQCVLGSFLFAGQICMSTERIVVHKQVSEEFQKKFAGMIEAIFPSKQDAPILVNANAAEKVRKLLKDAVSKGGSVIAGDIDAEEASKTRMRPIVIGKVTPEMDIYKTESFGPSVSLIEVETEQEALRIANDTEYGLASAVFTEDLRTGLRFAKGIESGAVHINNMTVHDESALPHGGVKASGYGRFNSSAGLEEWTRTKTITWRA
ncbi:aldehyde dehydrogenase domain-containing protein [Pseudomassariella vexata]|uniref:Aldehyde dehydrogenase domain-containing protein n=1 Tax=Pseudomassariella vexata TaxID=1141098 RepID=A0A1Y2D5H3_9PEZI|nr:aldehyde dehydrogenase domain-containing protein [Pseudomassariella vexata]ORY54559.1 aldehyde dehydrogenase domain-containing protein [Pseudomassariella vexata]